MTEVYLVISFDWEDIDDYDEGERVLGVFTTKEGAVKAANDYILKEISNASDKENYIKPEKELEYSDFKDNNGYEYYNNTDYAGSEIYIRVMRLNEIQ